jgi:hypothetical protein
MRRNTLVLSSPNTNGIKECYGQSHKECHMGMTGCAFGGFGIYCINCFRASFLSIPRGIVGIEGRIVLERILK